MKRRDFLKLTGMGIASLTVPQTLLAMGHGSGGGSLDPGDPGVFVNPLRLPGTNGGILGILDPAENFTIRAMTAKGPVLPGKDSNLLVYGVTADGKSYVDPILRVKKGQRLAPLLQNGLADPTIIHWHGLIVDSRNDGIPQDAIEGGASYQYDFKVRNRGGTYWYHPHPYALTSAQAYLGMASFFLVEDRDEIRLRQALDLDLGVTEIPLVIQDKRFDDAGNIVYNPSEEEWFMGFLGDTILANLTVNPFLDVETRIYRFRLLNGSNARIYRLAFTTALGKHPFHLVGTDGGLLERTQTVTELFLAPGERADILIDLSHFRGGDSLFLKSLAFDPMDNEGGMGGGMGTEPALPNGAEFFIMKLNVKRRMWHFARTPLHLSEVTPIRTSGARMRRITLALAEMGMKWTINGQTFDPNTISFEIDRNSVEIWHIKNEMMSMPHPMHVHGFQFQVLGRSMSPPQTAVLAVDRSGRLPTDLGWKDTVLLWPGETVRIAIDFSLDFPGPQKYVFHCHNLEHEDEGMMINYAVI